MFKRILFACAFPLLASATTTTFFPQGTTLQDVQTAPELIFGWDIHGVLAEKDGGALFGTVLGNLGTFGWSKLTDDKSWKEIEAVKKHSDISGEGRAQILRKNGKHSAARAVEEAANAYKPRKGMQVIVERLHTAGHEQRLASNIGPRCYENLKKKFKKSRHGNTMFDRIQLGKIVDYNALGDGTRNVSMDSRYLSPTPKPHGEFYESFTRTFDPFNKKLKITIDDRMGNILEATSRGYVGIFLDTKSKNPAKDLTMELERLDCFLVRNK